MRTASLVFARLANSNLTISCVTKIRIHGPELRITLGIIILDLTRMSTATDVNSRLGLGNVVLTFYLQMVCIGAHQIGF